VKVFSFFMVMVLLASGWGCAGVSRREAPSRPTRRIDWEDHISVMRGFLAAKKRGDWQTAYRCCDYDETLPKEERARIKEKWKEESKTWLVEYANTFWSITGQAYYGETAVVRILVSRRDPITRALTPGEVYQEKLKKYKGKWKITSLLAPEELS